MGLSQLFRERQIIIRSEHGVKYVRLSPMRQTLFAGVSALSLVSAAAWSLSTSAVYSDIRANGVAFVQSAYDRVMGRVSDQPLETLEAIPEDSNPVIVQAEATAAERIAELERRLEEAEAERRRLAAERDKLEAERLRLASSATAADKKAAALAAQQEAIQQLITRARAALDRTQRNVSKLGIEPSKLLAMAPRQGGAGGPFIEFKRAGRGSPAHNNLVALGESLDKLTDLQRAVRALPIGAPLSAYGLASPYGVRRDPFNGQLAMHNGLDMAAPNGAEIRARAPGKVVFAGRNGVYGNMVEIDHGYGLRTRYGHMSQISVRQGQTVNARDKLGAVGSTGRSTAPHLHYEISFNGKTIDPRKFVETKQHVFQN
ncbi:MAG TPA: M23 family metallopeptidase [Alphaproteobacteria bacterium]|nr:M23 family metallopeptidase [Alphaproteobacteria bacterium]